MFEFLKKRDHSATIQPAGKVLVVKGGQRLLTAALDAGLDWPHDCRVGSCGTCRCLLKSGRIKPLTDFVYTLSPEDIRAGAILACQSLLKDDVVVEIKLGSDQFTLETVDATISALRPLTHDIVEMVVTFDRPAFRSAMAGQYVDVKPLHLAEARSYSFARNPNGGDGQRGIFFIRHIPGGEFTDWLFASSRAGDRLQLRGPYGDFHRRDGAGRMICVAGGSGLAPIYALLEDAVRCGETRDCVVLFGARSERDLYYLDELAEISRRWAGQFALEPVLSHEPVDSAWSGARGLVTEQIASVTGIGTFGPDDQGYLCGPPAMVDAAIDVLCTMGMSKKAIFFDKFLDMSTRRTASDATA